MSTPRQVIFNTDEQWSSSDQNNAQGFAGQEFSDVLARFFASGQNAGMLSGALAGLGTLGNGGVLTGFEPGQGVSGVTVTVNPGLAFRLNSSPPALGSSFQSPWRWIKSTAQVTVALTPQVSAQIALIYASDATVQAPSGGTSRNVWNATLNTVQAVTLFKELDPSFGTAPGGTQGSFGVAYSAASLFPSLPAGCIPIALVYLAANQTGPIPPNQICDCRQLLAPGSFGASGLGVGLNLSWVGTGTGALQNYLKLSSGYGMVNGVPIRLASDLLCNFGSSPPPGILFDGAASGIAAAGAPSAVFYCYVVPSAVGGLPIGSIADASYAAGGGNVKLLICHVAPNRNGNLGGSVLAIGNSNSFANTAAPNFTIPAGAGQFVGSICTDASSNIIPFRRLGDRVMLTPNIAGVVGFWNPGGGYAAGGFTTSNSAPTAGATSIGFGSGGTAPLALPASANAMIADVEFFYTSAQAAGTVYRFGMMDAGQSTALAGGIFTELGQVASSVTVTSVEVTSNLRVDIVLDPITQKAWAVAPEQINAQAMTFNVIFRGYVEPVARLGF